MCSFFIYDISLPFSNVADTTFILKNGQLCIIFFVSWFLKTHFELPCTDFTTIHRP
jgi:hypothetical protein